MKNLLSKFPAKESNRYFTLTASRIIFCILIESVFLPYFALAAGGAVPLKDEEMDGIYAEGLSFTVDIAVPRNVLSNADQNLTHIPTNGVVYTRNNNLAKVSALPKLLALEKTSLQAPSAPVSPQGAQGQTPAAAPPSPPAFSVPVVSAPVAPTSVISTPVAAALEVTTPVIYTPVVSAQDTVTPVVSIPDAASLVVLTPVSPTPVSPAPVSSEAVIAQIPQPQEIMNTVTSQVPSATDIQDGMTADYSLPFVSGTEINLNVGGETMTFQPLSSGTNVVNISDSSQQFLSSLVNVNAAGSIVPIQINIVINIDSAVQSIANTNNLDLKNYFKFSIR
jgi:hypothetical protein